MRTVVVELAQTCDSCPSQWEGRTEDGRYVYVRYRWGNLQVGFGPTIEAAIFDETIDRQIGDRLDGSLTYADLVTTTAAVIDWPRDVSRRHPTTEIR
jgi:hypothetical protein